MAPAERKVFLWGLFVLAQLVLSVSSADSKGSNATSSSAVPSSTTPSPSNGTLTLVIKKGNSSPLSAEVKLIKGSQASDEEDCDDEPVPEPEGSGKTNSTRQGKELTLGNPSDKYTLGNATAEPEPESTGGHNGTATGGSGTNDKLTGNNSTTEAPATGTASSTFSNVATLSAVLGSFAAVLFV